jgi:hypothetical protein
MAGGSTCSMQREGRGQENGCSTSRKSSINDADTGNESDAAATTLWNGGLVQRRWQ